MALVNAVLDTLYTPLRGVTGLVISDVFDFGTALDGRSVTFQWGAGGALAPTEVDWSIQSSLDGETFVQVVREVSLQGIRTISVPGRYIRLAVNNIVGGLTPTFTVMMQT